MASKLLYLLMDWENFNYAINLLEQVRSVIRGLQTSMMVSNVTLKTLSYVNYSCK